MTPEHITLTADRATNEPASVEHVTIAAQSGADKYPTQPGWYCIVFNLENGERDYGPIYQFEDGAWFDESGDEVETFYDPFLGMRVSTRGADDYVRQ